MWRRWSARALAVVGFAMIIAGPVPAVAHPSGGSTSVDPAILPLTAAQVATADVCRLGGGPYPDQNVWAFATGAGQRLDSLSAAFMRDDGERDIWQLSPADQALDPAGRSVAWLRTPTGWTLTAAAGEIAAATELTGTTETGADDPLLVVGACPAAEAVGLTQARDSTVRAPAAAPVPPGPSTLPTTGQDIGGMLAIGAGLVVAGGLLLSVRRRRPAPVEPSPRIEDDVRVWTYPNR